MTNVEKQLERLNKKINTLLELQKRETWIGPSWVSDLTGWNKEKLRQAREQGVVRYKRSEGGGYKYCLESIPDQFIIQSKSELPAAVSTVAVS